MSTDRADLEVNLNGNKHGLSQMLREASKEVNAFAKETTEEVASSWSLKNIVGGALGFFGLEAAREAFEGWMEHMVQIKNVSEELGLSADETERWGLAAQRVGSELQQVANLMSMIQEKRLQAANDPKAASLFQQLGVSREDVLNTEKLNISQFIEKLNLNREDDTTRRLLYELVGARGFKTMRGAAAQFPTTTATSTEEEREAAEAMHRGTGWLRRQFQNVVGGVMDSFYHVFGKGDIFTPGTKDFLRNPLGVPAGMTSPFAVQGGVGGGMTSPAVESHQAAKEEATKIDPLKAYYDDLEEKHAKQMVELNERLRESQRGTMTIGERRADIEKEIAELAQDILDAETDPALFNTYATQEEVAKWRIKEAELRKQLIERPTEWQTKAAAFAAAGGTTFGGTAQHNAVVAELKNMHDTIKRNGTF